MSLYAFSVSQNWLPKGQLEQLKTCEEAHLFDLLLRHCPVSEETLLLALGTRFGFVVKRLEGVSPDPAVLSRYDPKWMIQMGIMPLFQMGQTVVVAAHNPFHPELEILRKQQLRLEIWQVNRYELLQVLSPDNGRDPLLSSLLDSAIERKASDIVVHAAENGGAIKFRVEGTLIPIRLLTSSETKRVIQLIKLEAHLEIGEAQKPQDGRLEHHREGGVHEGRVSLIPTLYGEDAVIRLFYSDQTQKTLSQLGFLERPLLSISSLLSERSGLILVTGPTGSGKTTTLYAMLRELSEDRTKSIVSLEDPIESHLPGIRQSQVNPEKDYTYAEGLKSMLRQDPDVLMIGEIRDAKTAHLVLEAAYTGHLVLSTLHTGSVMASLLRCLSFGCDPFMLRYALKGVISQTLLPKKCGSCGAEGCLQCDFKGLSGRVLISEMLRLQEPTSVGTDPATWIEEGDFYAYNADTQAKQKLGWI